MALGKGLGAFFNTSPTIVESQKQKRDETTQRVVTDENTGTLSTTNIVYNIPLTAIHSNPTQPRKNFSIDELQELVTSIEQHGILQPIIVTEISDGTYQIVSGERRFRAVSMLGMTTIPAIVKPVDNRTKVEIALIENIQRENLNSIEEAFAYKRLVEEFGQTIEDVARSVGKSRPHISNMMRLLDLPQDIQRGMIEGKISHTKARALLGLPTIRQQLKAYHDMIGDKKMTVRETETLVRGERVTKGWRDPLFDEIEKRLRERLGMRVYVAGSRQRGSIKFEFYSEEEFKRVLELIEGIDFK